MTCKECVHCKVCFAVATVGKFKENAEYCKNFKNKADFAEVVRCGKCKHGDVSTISKSRDGQEEIACYCTLKKATTDVDSYCPSGERRDT